MSADKSADASADALAIISSRIYKAFLSLISAIYWVYIKHILEMSQTFFRLRSIEGIYLDDGAILWD